MASSLTNLVLLTAVFVYPFSGSVQAEVDPSWLASWNEAVANQPSELKSFAKIVSSDEPGTRLMIRGLVVDPNGHVAQGVIVHAYHRDSQGFDFGYKDKELTTWRIQGWAITDRQGRFTFDTIKPAPDYLGREDGHIHFTTISENYGRQWALKAYLSGDEPLAEKQKLHSLKEGNYGAIRKIETKETLDVAIKLKTEPDF